MSPAHLLPFFCPPCGSLVCPLLPPSQASPRVRFNRDGSLLAVTAADNSIKVLANEAGARLIRNVEAAAAATAAAAAAAAVVAVANAASSQPHGMDNKVRRGQQHNSSQSALAASAEHRE